ncbi:MAG: hypothetical protein LBJ46_00960, partial [Planctomycetota bacterium]|nr:hypothetical protein [Planctomycetota bacterium]
MSVEEMDNATISEKSLSPIRPAAETATPDELDRMRRYGMDPSRYGRPVPFTAEQPEENEDGTPAGASALDSDSSAESPMDSLAARGTPEQLARARKYGIDPASVRPPEKMETSPYAIPGGALSWGYSPGQIRFAVNREENPVRQLDHYAAINDVRSVISNARRMGLPDKVEAERIQKEFGIPAPMVETFKRAGSDDYESLMVAAYVTKTAGTDSYAYRKFSNDPAFAADWQAHGRALADVQSLVKTAYASRPEIAWNWFAGGVAGSTIDMALGIPAAVMQAGGDIRRDLSARITPDRLTQNVAASDDLLAIDPFAAIEALQVNHDIAQWRGMLEKYLTDPEYAASAQAGEEALQRSSDWINEKYGAAKSLAYAPPSKTGSWVGDTLARPIAQGVGSLLPSLGAGALLGEARGMVGYLFGASEAGNIWRENREAGVDTATNVLASLGIGAASGAAEQFSLDRIWNSQGVRGLWKGLRGSSTTARAAFGRVIGDAVKSGATEAATEGIQTSLSIAAPPLARAISLGEPFENVWNAILDGGWEIAESMWGGFGAGVVAGGTVGRGVRESRGMVDYGRSQRAMNAIGDKAAQLVRETGDRAKVEIQVRNMLHEGIAERQTGLKATQYADAGDVQRFMQNM